MYLLIGFLCFYVAKLETQLSAAITLGNINNVLIIVFAAEFFGPLEPTVAAMYMFPFFGSIIPLKLYRRWRTQGDGGGA